MTFMCRFTREKSYKQMGSILFREKETRSMNNTFQVASQTKLYTSILNILGNQQVLLVLS